MEERKLNKPGNDIITQNKKSKSKKPVFIAVVSVILAIAIAVGVYFSIPFVKYNLAILLSEKGEYEKAMSYFDELGDYKDSKKLYIQTVDSSKIADAKKLFEENNHVAGYKLLKEVAETEEVKVLKSEYGPKIIDLASSNIVRTESEDGSHFYFRSEAATKFEWSAASPYFEIYVEKSNGNEENFRIILGFDYIFNYNYMEGFQTPVHPVNLIFSNGTDSVAVDVNMFERSFESMMPGWHESVSAEINILEYNDLTGLFTSGEKITVDAVGISKNIKFTLDEEKVKAATAHSDYINAVQLVYGVNEDIDVDKVKSEVNQYEQSAGVMLGAIEVIDEIGISKEYLDEFKEIYSHIQSLEPEQNSELVSAVNKVYNTSISYYEYCLNPTVDMSNCPGNIGWAVNIYKSTYINTYKSQLRSYMTTAISHLNELLSA